MAERFSHFIKHSLGLERDDTVRLLPHNSGWAESFKVESQLILENIGIPSMRLFHAGSTAIPFIVAKPILDIVGQVKSLQELDAKKTNLEKIGYVYKGEYGVAGRRYSVLYNPEQSLSYCHLHIFEEGTKVLEEHLLFYQYLSQNKAAALRYEEVKLSLKLPRSQYTRGKSAIIQQVLNEAKAWSQKQS